jgi:hypothetical protein
MEMNRHFKGIFIPREIWLCPDLNAQEKALWAEIDSLYCQEKGGCYASNEYLCAFTGVKERCLQDMLSKLKKLGYLEQVSFDGRQRILRAIKPNDKQSFCRAEVQKSAPQEKQGCRKVHLSDAENRTPRGIPTVYIERKEEKKDIASPAENPEKSSPQTVSSKPLRAKKEDISFCKIKYEYIGITEEDKANWRKIYPAIDLEMELLKNIDWIKSNPSKANKSLWRKHLCRWFEVAQNNASRQAMQKSYGAPPIDRRTKNKDGSAVEKDYGF